MIGHRSEDYASIAAWLVAYLSRLLHVAPEAISVHRPFNSFGIDSSQAVTFAADLEKWLNTRLPATLAWDYPTIDSLSKHLSTTDFPLAELLTEIEQSTEEDGLMPIAIIGVGCRFPGASGPDAFWQLLVPVLGQQVVLSRVTRGDAVTLLDWAIPALVAFAIAGVAVAAVSRLLGDERIVFGRA